MYKNQASAAEENGDMEKGAMEDNTVMGDKHRGIVDDAKVNYNEVGGDEGEEAAMNCMLFLLPYWLT